MRIVGAPPFLGYDEARRNQKSPCLPASDFLKKFQIFKIEAGRCLLFIRMPMLMRMPAVPAAMGISSVISVGWKIVREPMVIIVFVRSIRIVRMVVGPVIIRFHPYAKTVIRFCLGSGQSNSYNCQSR